MLRFLDLNLWWNAKLYNLRVTIGTGLILLNLTDASLRKDEFQQRFWGTSCPESGLGA